MCKGYKIDVLNNKVLLTGSFLRAAGRLGTPEYKTMMDLRRELPEYKFEEETTTRKKTTNKNKNLTYQNMRGHIQAVYGDTQKGKEALETLDKVVALSKIQSNPYKYVRDWFVNEFPNYNSAASLYNCEELSDTFAATI